MTPRLPHRRRLVRAGWVGGIGAAFALLGAYTGPPPAADRPDAPLTAGKPPPATGPIESPPVAGAALVEPGGSPPHLSCGDAQRVVAFLESELSTPAISPLPRELAEPWAGLLDPHGLWSAPPDSPVRSALDDAARDMLESLRERIPGCPASHRVARAWLPWQARLAAAFDEAVAAAEKEEHSLDGVFQLAAEPIFEDDPVSRPGLELARELGARLGAVLKRFPEARPLVQEASRRFFPRDEAMLADIATLAAVRAYVPLVDPHGGFAPLEEEWALYAGDVTLDSGSALWGEVARTPLGARVLGDPKAPLKLDDLVVSIDGWALAGASTEQIEQAARREPKDGVFHLVVLRRGSSELVSLDVRDLEEPPEPTLELELVGYGRDRRLLRVGILDVTDDLAEELAAALEREGPAVDGVLLDLRGNGGGSLDAAVDALGLFLPGARLFPLIHRGVVTEVLQAPFGARAFTGPLAVLVDGDTASAAEMLAGAIQAYERGVVIGARTFGKGCVQEYFDAVVPGGVLRLTTLQFVMPNGKPLQQLGLTPNISLSLPPALERESELARQPITYAGPSVRDGRVAVGPSWPRSKGAVGPCREPLVCSVLSRLSGVHPGGASVTRAARPRAGTR